MSSKSRVIRVFLSSTFKDFAEERDLLVKKVFPELRRLCRERQVELVDVDLRWGITEEEAQQGKVLPICLQEINRARPYFMGFIGERYGWVPNENQYPEVVIQQQPWIEEHQGGKSVTELEMLHGVLNNPDMAGRAYFYFRDAKYSNSKGGDYEVESPEHAAKLEDLRERIRASKFPVVENYPDPEALAEKVRNDLRALIEEEYPEEDVPDALTLERMRHEAYGAARRKLYLGGDEYFKLLDDAVAMESEKSIPVLVTAEAGLGKSALISNWLEKWRKNNPDALVFLHHFSASSDAASPVNMVRRLMSESELIVGNTSDVGSDPEEVFRQLPLIMDAMSSYAIDKECKWLIILDGIDKISEHEHLRWFPRSIPEGIEFVVSSTHGSVGEIIDPLLNWEKVEIKPFSEQQCREFISSYMGNFHKTLTEEMVKSILEHSLSDRPMWLLTLLEELRLFGVHEEVEARLITLLSDPPSKIEGELPTIDDLYEHVLARIEEDIEEDYEVEVLKAIWASYDGLSRTELLELTGMPPAKWAEIQNVLDENLFESCGQITFGNQFIRKAVEDMHLSTIKEKRAAHQWLGEWFKNREVSLDMAREIIHHWFEAGDLDKFRSCLLDEFIFVELYQVEDRWSQAGDLYKFWKIYLKMSPSEVEEAYEEAFVNWSGDEDNTRALRNFLDDLSCYGSFATRLQEEWCDQINKKFGPMHRKAIRASYHLGCYYLFNQGCLDEAERILRDSLKRMTEIYGPEDPLTLFNTAQLGNTLQYKKQFDEAEALYRKNLASREKVLGKNYIHTLWSVNDLGSLLRDKGEYEEAEPLLRRVLSEKRKILVENDTDLVRSVHRLGIFLLKKGDLDESEILLKEAYAKRLKFFGAQHKDFLSSCKALGSVLRLKGQTDQACIYLKQAFEGYNSSLPENHRVRISSALNFCGFIAEVEGYDKGVSTLEEYLKKLEKSGDFLNIAYARIQCSEKDLYGAKIMADIYLRNYPEEKENAIKDEDLAVIRGFIETL